ncbi:MAG: hypothetical protein QNJ72_13245 [Pleurocapsa sp. MO_226.B13]|nr:hypothetical protein [Pleurocapsa sp. MO_226.B13]
MRHVGNTTILTNNSLTSANKEGNTRKPCQHKPLVQIERELTEAQLEAIAAGGFTLN